MMKILNTELNKKYSKTTVFLVYLVFLFNFISIVIHKNNNFSVFFALKIKNI